MNQNNPPTGNSMRTVANAENYYLEDTIKMVPMMLGVCSYTSYGLLNLVIFFFIATP